MHALLRTLLYIHLVNVLHSNTNFPYAMPALPPQQLRCFRPSLPGKAYWKDVMAAVFFWSGSSGIRKARTGQQEAVSPSFSNSGTCLTSPGFGFQKALLSFRISYTQTPWITHLSLKNAASAWKNWKRSLPNRIFSMTRSGPRKP